MDAEAGHRGRIFAPIRFIAVWGPGLLVMLADTDAGNVVTAAQSGALWRYRLLPLLLILIPLLYMIQELTVRLGIFTGRGCGELIREKFGRKWAWGFGTGLGLAVIGTMITEFTAVAGVGEIYGLSRSLTLPLASAALLSVVITGSYRRVELASVIIGLFELAFFAIAWAAHPDFGAISRDAGSLPYDDREFLYFMAALIGTVFNPWMISYQQSAVVDKGLTAADLTAARWDTAFGAALTQLLTGAVLISAAATFGDADAPVRLVDIGQISEALTPALGSTIGRLVFSTGVLGAAMVAAIVSSLALSWGIGEIAGYRRSLEYRPQDAAWFYGFYTVCVVGAAGLVWLVPDLVWLNVAAQVANAFLLPLVSALLIVLAATVLPEAHRLRGWYLWCVAVTASVICVLGLAGGLAGML